MDLIGIIIDQICSGILGGIISGLVIAFVFLFFAMEERKQQQNQNKAFFIENTVDNAYFLDLSTLEDKNSSRHLDKIKIHPGILTR